MLVGVPKEIKMLENRVGLVPASVRELIHHGHEVLVESTAGIGIGFDDDVYRGLGAEVADGPEEVFARADMIVKVKEPQPVEYGMLREGQGQRGVVIGPEDHSQGGRKQDGRRDRNEGPAA